VSAQHVSRPKQQELPTLSCRVLLSLQQSPVSNAHHGGQDRLCCPADPTCPSAPFEAGWNSMV